MKTIKNIFFSERFTTYDWANDNGYNKIVNWIEAAIQKAGR